MEPQQDRAALLEGGAGPVALRRARTLEGGVHVLLVGRGHPAQVGPGEGVFHGKAGAFGRGAEAGADGQGAQPGGEVLGEGLVESESMVHGTKSYIV